MESEYADLGLTIAQYLLPVFLALVSWGTVKLTAWLDAKTKHAKVMGMLARLTESGYVVARSIEQRVVARIKRGREPGSPGGTRLTEDEIAEVADEGLAAMREYWGAPGLVLLKKILGLGDTEADSLLKHNLEAAVHDMPPKNGVLVAREIVDPSRGSTPD